MRLLAPTLGVLFLAALIGCGGGGTSPSFGVDPDTTAGLPTTTSGNANGGDPGTTDLRAAAGDYTVAFAGSDGATALTGTGTGTANATGAIGLSLPATGTSNSTARAVSATVATNGLVTGTVTVGTAAAATITAGTLAKQAAGVYLLTATYADATAAVHTDRYTITYAQTTFTGPNAGTDDQRATYGGQGTATITAGNVLSLEYTSIRSLTGSVTRTHSLSTTLLSNGTFSGSLGLGFSTTPATGTWSLSAANVLKLTLKYTNPDFVDSSGRNPKVTETLTLTKG